MFIKSFRRAPYALLILNIIMFILFTMLQSAIQGLHRDIIENEKVTIEKMNELFFKELNSNIALMVTTGKVDPFNADDLQSLYNRIDIEYDLDNTYATKYLLTCNYDNYTKGYYYTMIKNGVEYRIVSYTKDGIVGNLCLVIENEIDHYIDHTNPEYYNKYLNSYNFDKISKDNPDCIDTLYELGIITEDSVLSKKYVLSEISKLSYNPNQDPVKMNINIQETNYSFYYLTVPNIGMVKSEENGRRLIFLNFINEDALSSSFTQRNSVLINVIQIIRLLVLIDILLMAILLMYIKTILQNMKRGDVTAKSIEVRDGLYKSFLDGSNENDIL